MVRQTVEKLQDMEKHLTELAEDFTENETEFTVQELKETKESYFDLLKAVLQMLDGRSISGREKKTFYYDPYDPEHCANTYVFLLQQRML